MRHINEVIVPNDSQNDVIKISCPYEAQLVISEPSGCHKHISSLSNLIAIEFLLSPAPTFHKNMPSLLWFLQYFTLNILRPFLLS